MDVATQTALEDIQGRFSLFKLLRTRNHLMFDKLSIDLRVVFPNPFPAVSTNAAISCVPEVFLSFVDHVSQPHYTTGFLSTSGTVGLPTVSDLQLPHIAQTVYKM